jgi:hypothetical protein
MFCGLFPFKTAVRAVLIAARQRSFLSNVFVQVLRVNHDIVGRRSGRKGRLERPLRMCPPSVLDAAVESGSTGNPSGSSVFRMTAPLPVVKEVQYWWVTR